MQLIFVCNVNEPDPVSHLRYSKLVFNVIVVNLINEHINYDFSSNNINTQVRGVHFMNQPLILNEPPIAIDR